MVRSTTGSDLSGGTKTPTTRILIVILVFVCVLTYLNVSPLTAVAAAIALISTFAKIVRQLRRI